MKLSEIQLEAESLPLELRVQLIDSLLGSLHKIEKDIEEAWIRVAEKRLKEYQLGLVESIPGKEVFDRIQKKYGT